MTYNTLTKLVADGLVEKVEVGTDAGYRMKPAAKTDTASPAGDHQPRTKRSAEPH